VIAVCLYLQVHQPWRLKKYDYFDVGRDHDYFDDAANGEIARRVARRCYRPAASLLAALLERHSSFAVSLSFSGCVLDQLARFAPEALDGFRELSLLPRVEILAETSHHSLASLVSLRELREQVAAHSRKIQAILGRQPRVFRNTELIYSDDVARFAETAGFTAILADGVPPLLGAGASSPRHVYRAATPGGLPLLLRDFRMSDDIAFRFSDRSWAEYPLTAEKYERWVAGSRGDVLSLFMDFETFGEHQRAETGIFDFFEDWVARHVARGGKFLTVSEAVAAAPLSGRLSSPGFVSWADEARDVSAWQGNELQRDALSRLFALENAARASKSETALEDFRRLTTSDHFYYMATKRRSDAAVHEYFSPWETPYDAYMAFRHVLTDLERRLPSLPSGSRRTAARTRGSVPPEIPL
jgi:alpha-amylase